MKLLVAGGRDKTLNDKGFEYLDRLHAQFEFTELVNGMATGIDASARQWANNNSIPIKEFPARWGDTKDVPKQFIKINRYGRKYNSKAGPDRNKDMVIDLQTDSPPGVVVVFPGGDGTRNLYETAKDFDLLVYDMRKNEELLV